MSSRSGFSIADPVGDGNLYPNAIRVLRRGGCAMATGLRDFEAGGTVTTMETSRRVVVGVDGSAPSRGALERAAVEAGAHGAVLEVVHAWDLLSQPGPAFDPHYGEEAATDRIKRVVEETLGSVPSDVVLTVVNDRPLQALMDRAVGAFTLVVGSRGMSEFKGLILGSVSHHAVVHAPCPVLVVHTDAGVRATPGDH